jgi:hypothetical protein
MTCQSQRELTIFVLKTNKIYYSISFSYYTENKQLWNAFIK